jgi:glutaredoxin
MRYILFIKEECPFCRKAMEFLEKKELSYSVVNFLPGQQTVLKEIKEAYNWPTVPMVFERQGSDIKFIGGFTDLEKWLVND